jgi:DNA polymerase III delta prime subunit
MEKGSHVDLKRIVRGGAGSVIKISQITPRPEDKENPPEASLQEFFRTAALMSNRKVVIIQDAERMNSQAANALLKILEEPHSYAKLILTTNYLSSLLPTTLSRCVCIPIELPAGSESHLRPRFEAFANKLRHAKKQQMLVLSEEFRALCNTIELEDGSGARLSQAKALSLLAAAMIQTDPDRPDRVHHVIDAHRRILGNASSSLLFDALFASIA